MHRTDLMDAATNVLRRILPAVLLPCLAVSGCGYTCYSGFWNGNGSGVGGSNSSCPLAKATGTVAVQMTAVSAPSGTSAAFPSPFASPNDVEHIFVTFRGIEAHSARAADASSSGWQALAPDLAAHPAQLDLLSVNADSQSLGLSSTANVPATVPADEYLQLRLLLAPLHPSPDDIIPESNACGNVGWNCIVFADSSVRPLEFGGSAAEFKITPKHVTDNVFRVLPGDVIQLSIEFDLASSALFASNAAVQLVPAFRVVSGASSPAANSGPIAVSANTLKAKLLGN